MGCAIGWAVGCAAETLSKPVAPAAAVPPKNVLRVMLTEKNLHQPLVTVKHFLLANT